MSITDDRYAARTEKTLINSDKLVKIIYYLNFKYKIRENTLI